jgi:hypothetical protein
VLTFLFSALAFGLFIYSCVLLNGHPSDGDCVDTACAGVVTPKCAYVVTAGAVRL